MFEAAMYKRMSENTKHTFFDKGYTPKLIKSQSIPISKTFIM